MGAVVLGTLLIYADAAEPRTVSSPTRAKLRLMPLPRSSYGASAAAFRTDSGWFDNKQTAAADIDPTMTAAKLDRMGRITGYSVGFTERAQTFPSGRLINVSSVVDLFRSENGATRYLAHVASEFRPYHGKNLDLDHVSTFPVGELRGAQGVNLRVRTPSQTTWVTSVQFQEGVVTANVGLVRTDGRDIRADARILAAALDRRIRGVLAGTVHDSPLPKPTPKLGGFGPPPGGPNPALMAIRSTDFSPPLKVLSQFYKRNSTDFAEYIRNFGGGVLIGSAILPNVTADVELRPSAEAATASLAKRRSLFTGAQSRTSMRRAIASGTPEYVRREWQIGAVSRVTIRAGDAALAFEATVTVRGTRVDAVVCTVRRRSVVETLTLLSGPNGMVAPQLTLRLARAAVAHIDSALHR